MTKYKMGEEQKALIAQLASNWRPVTKEEAYAQYERICGPRRERRKVAAKERDPGCEASSNVDFTAQGPIPGVD